MSGLLGLAYGALDTAIRRLVWLGEDPDRVRRAVEDALAESSAAPGEDRNG